MYHILCHWCDNTFHVTHFLMFLFRLLLTRPVQSSHMGSELSVQQQKWNQKQKWMQDEFPWWVLFLWCFLVYFEKNVTYCSNVLKKWKKVDQFGPVEHPVNHFIIGWWAGVLAHIFLLAYWVVSARMNIKAHQY